MNLLLDTHLLLWSARDNDLPRREADRLIKDTDNTLWFSVVSIWEVAIKRALNRPGFRAEAAPLRAGLLANGYLELPVEGRHILSLTTLPLLHGDPFDRLLLAQAVSEGLLLLTADSMLASYAVGPVRLV